VRRHQPRTTCILSLVLIAAGVIGAQPNESVRGELIRLQEQNGLTLAGYNSENLNVALFAARSLSSTGDHFSKGARMGAISPDGTEVGGEFDSLSSMFGTSRLDGTDRRDYPAVFGPYRSCWNYDKSKIAMSIRDSAGPIHSALRILDVASKTTRDIDSSAFIYLTSQCWSPDGIRITYETQEPLHQKKDTTSEIVNPTVKIFDFEANKSRAFAAGSDPSWSPDGKWIAFRDHDTYYEIKPNGDDRKTLFHKQQAYSGLIWSPDSRIVAYLSLNGLFERPILMDVEPVRLRVRRLADNSEDWLAQLYSTNLLEFQWLENKDLVSRAKARTVPK
jgi:WD40-like Beta Propeller Repeat